MPPPMPLASTGGPSAFSGSGVKEVIDYTFLHGQNITSATAAAYSYFNAAGTNVVPLLNNFEGTGQMPAGQAFRVRTIRAIVQPQAASADLYSLLSNASLVFTVENAKKYVNAPLFCFPAGVGQTVETYLGNAVPATPANSIIRSNNGIPSLGNVYTLRRPIILHPQQPFQVVVNVAAAATFGSTVTLYIAMDGDLERNII